MDPTIQQEMIETQAQLQKYKQEMETIFAMAKPAE
jgi:uncharacterized membrane-anchored protein YhcB (DUF1043 family)